MLNEDDDYMGTWNKLSTLKPEELKELNLKMEQAEEDRVPVATIEQMSSDDMKQLDQKSRLELALGLVRNVHSMLQRQTVNMIRRIKEEPEFKVRMEESVRCDELRAIIHNM